MPSSYHRMVGEFAVRLAPLGRSPVSRVHVLRLARGVIDGETSKPSAPERYHLVNVMMQFCVYSTVPYPRSSFNHIP